jgi:hypothetical protein
MFIPIILVTVLPLYDRSGSSDSRNRRKARSWFKLSQKRAGSFIMSASNTKQVLLEQLSRELHQALCPVLMNQPDNPLLFLCSQ